MDNREDPMFVVLEDPFTVTVEEIAPEFREKASAWNQLEQPRYAHEESKKILSRMIGVLANQPMCTDDYLALNTLFLVVKNDSEYRPGLVTKDNFYTYLLNMGRFYMDYLAANIPEFSREMVLWQLKVYKKRKTDLANEGKRYVDLVKEDENSHVSDILGLVLDELRQEKKIDETESERLAEDFQEPVSRWRALKVPKTMDPEAYGIMKQIFDLCCEHGAFHTALLLIPILVTCAKESETRYAEALFSAGKALFELGYEEIAKNCFQRADEFTDHACWSDGNEKYREILTKETMFEVPEWMTSRDQRIRQMIKSGEARLLPFSEIKKIKRPKP